MDQNTSPEQATGNWRYLVGIGFFVWAAALALLGYLLFPHGNPMDDSWAKALHTSGTLVLGAFGCFVAGAAFIAYEMLRRHDRRVEASCPIDRKAYREALLRMMRQSERHPKTPVDPQGLRRMLEILEPADVAHRAGYQLTSTEE